MWQIWFWCFLLFTVYFARIPHPTIVLHCNLLTRDTFFHFIIYFVSSTVSQFHPYFIMNSLYLQGSLKYQTWLHYPIILKVNLWKRFISFWHRKIPGKVTIWKNLVAHVLSQELFSFIRLLWSFTWCIYLKCIHMAVGRQITSFSVYQCCT